jgi:hypothetical protein
MPLINMPGSRLGGFGGMRPMPRPAPASDISPAANVVKAPPMRATGGLNKPLANLKKGGKVKKTGLYRLHKGEKVISAARTLGQGRARKGKSKPWRKPRGKAKMDKVYKEFGAGKLHSGSKKGPVVKSPAQATAIAISEAKKELAGGYK